MNTAVEMALARYANECNAARVSRSDPWRKQIREFADANIRPVAALADREQHLPRSVVDALIANRYLCFLVSPRYGGGGGDFIRYGTIHEEFGRVCSSTRTLLTVHDMVSYAIERWGTEAQRHYWLPPLASGTLLGAFCLSESSVGSDAVSVQTTAVATDGGFVLNGEKTWISFGQIASVLLVIARHDQKVSAFLVDSSVPGITRTPIKDMLGMRGTMLARVVFQNCFVPADNLLGGVGTGISHVGGAALQVGRYSVAAGCVGIGQACVEQCYSHARTRQQFGVLLREHQLVQGNLADLLVDVRSARLVCNQAGYSLATGSPFAPIEVMEAKYVASRMAARAARCAVQMHGAIGCQECHPVARLYRDAKVMEVIEGTNEVLQTYIARHGAPLI